MRMEKNPTAVLEVAPAATEWSFVSFTAATTILPLRGGGTVPDGQQVIMARDVTVLGEVVWILCERPVIVEYSLDNTHCGFCDNQGHINLSAVENF